MPRQPTSPITGGAVDMLEAVDPAAVIALYRRDLSIDIADHLNGIDQIRRLRCRDTGYEFFWPPEIAGDPAFYRDLYAQEAHADWAYKAERWEFGLAAELASPEMALLDIGAGDGAFLRMMRPRVASVAGLETSPYGREAAARHGLTLHDQTIEAHAADPANRYDLVTALQVLEHVTDPGAFLRACRAALKPGGLLFVAVPDNDGFVGAQADLPLNMPPHHMGRWRRASLEAVAAQFDLEPVRVEREPLQPDLLGWYQSAMEARHLPRSRLARSLFHRLGYAAFFARFLRDQAHTIHGHTIAAIWRRPLSDAASPETPPSAVRSTPAPASRAP